jgi:polysaccharide biosynthesis transport protein
MNNTYNDDYRGGLPARQIRMTPAEYISAPPVLQGSVSDTDTDVAVLMQYLLLLWKHKWLIVSTVLLGLVVGLGASLWVTPLYKSSTSIVIEENAQAGAGVVDNRTMDNLSTQIQLLTSRAMVTRTVTKLNDSPGKFPEVRDPLQPFRSLLGLDDPAKSVTWSEALGWAAATRRVNPNKDSRVLTIESSSPNPQAASDFTNTLAVEFIANSKEERWKSYQDTGEWLTKAQEELKQKVEESERRLQDFARRNGLIIASSQNATEEKLRQLSEELARATADRIDKESKYESSTSSPTEALEILDSGPLSTYQVKIAELRQELALLSTTLTPTNPRVQKVDAQIKELQAASNRERQNVISRIRVDFESAKRREAQLEQKFKEQAQLLSGQGEQMIQYNILLREVETNKKLYDQTNSQGKEVSLASAMRTKNVHIVDLATAPMVPQSPNVPLNLGLGLMGGFLCGTALVILRSAIDARVHLPGALGIHHNVRELGVIPARSLCPDLQGGRFLRRIIGEAKEKASRTPMSIVIPRDEASQQPLESLELVTWLRKSSVMSEAYRSAMTSILLSGNGHTPQVLLVTSPSPQEGETSVTSNLAIALAEINQRVLIIDADMRLPRLHTIFDIPNTFGLSDFLHERRPIEEYLEEELVRKTQIPNLYVMPAGPARSNLSRLVHSGRVKELLQRFRGRFDTILIDSAPVLTVPDARILGRSADAVILVIRAHRTQHESAFAAVRSFDEDGTPLLGTILNDWNPKRSPHGKAYSPYGAYAPYGSE